jgi:hypothetical protein
MLQTSELSSLDLDAKTLLASGLPLSAISYLERYMLILAPYPLGIASTLSFCPATLHYCFLLNLRFSGEKGVGDLAVDSDGNTLLHIAAASTATTYDACKKLVALGLGVNTANKANVDTPMHVAAKCGNIEVRNTTTVCLT